MKNMKNMKIAAKNAKKVSIELAAANTKLKNEALNSIINGLNENAYKIFEANKIDIKRSEDENLDDTLLKRLKFDDKKMETVIDGIRDLIVLEDPVGKITLHTKLDDNLELYRESCPIGVIGVIFESRPDALVQIASLCLKSGNALLLKGGSEAKETNRILTEVIAEYVEKVGISKDFIYNLETRDDVKELLSMDEYIDLIIPRGSNEFVKYILNNSKIPVLGHADGICHGYIHKDADIDMAIKVINDSKTQYVSVCNAMETLLVHKDIAKKLLPKVKELFKDRVVIKGCQKTLDIIDCEKATEDDWKTEYLDYVISIKIVDDMKEAIEHINEYGSGHTDIIVTSSEVEARGFMMLVDSANVFMNASSRFADGFRYGFGAEVGISTNKIHARGPVGLEGIMIYKYKLFGAGQIVDDYEQGKSKFKHINYLNN